MPARLLLQLLALGGVAARDYYRDLGLRRGASQADIKAAYREGAKKYHPDKNKEPGADQRFKAVAEAYETLSDVDKRRQYDMYGDDYENVAKQREQQQQRQQHFYDPFSRQRRPQATPIFSVTMTLTPENYRDLVEDSDDAWVLQFYHDHSEPCKEFSQRWEALAHKLPPMVKLGRVRIDDNYGLVQKYRSFLRCRQTAFFLQCDAPALILARNVDGETTAEMYRGTLSAELVYEWVKRSFTDTRRSVQSVAGSDHGLQNFLQPAPRRGRPAPEPGRLPPKALFFTSRASADSLLARYIASYFKETLTFGSVHVEGGLNTGSEAAKLAASCGVDGLPAVVVWPDGKRGSDPMVHLIGSSPDAKQRKALIEAIEQSAVPSVPLLSAANLHGRCAPGAWDEDFAFCVLLVLPKASGWDEPSKRAYATLQALKNDGGSLSRVRYAWVDAQRQQPFATFLANTASGRHEHQRQKQGEDAKRPTLYALRGQEGGKGLRKARAARYAGPLEQVSQAVLRDWLEQLTVTPSTWHAAKTVPPPLRAETRPSLPVRFYGWVLNGGWLALLLLAGGAVALAFYLPDVMKQFQKQPRQQQQQQQQQRPQQQQQQQQQQQRTQAGAEPRPRREPEPTRQDSGASAREAAQPSAAASALQLLSADTADALVASPYLLVCVINAGAVDGATMRALGAHMAELFGASVEWRGWQLCFLDYSSQVALPTTSKPPLIRALLARLRSCPCAVVRKGQRLVAYSGQPTPGRVEEWIGRLRMGELTWESLGLES